MHFNFHLSGDESPEQSRRIANAVLALGGLLAPLKSTSAGEITVDVKIDTTQATAALDKLAAHPGAKWVEEDAVTANAGESPSEHAARDEYLSGIVDRSEALLTDAPPVPEVPAVASAAPPLPTTSAVAPSGLDAKGLPWDERIHSSNRKLNADGTWRYRKNVPDETKQGVEAELRGLVQAPLYPSTPAQLAAIRAEPVDNYSTSITLPNCEIRPDPTAVRSIHTGNTEVYAAPRVPVPPTPPAPPVPAGAPQRTYSDVVNLIMARKVQPDTYVAILGMSLPEFAKHVISTPNDATLMFDALDAASRS